MKKKIKRILTTKFIKRSKIILIGTLVSQLITFLTSFIITSYYSPEDMGLIGTLTALISIIAGTLMFRLDLAIIQAKETDKVFETFLRSTVLSCLSSLILCGICLFLPWSWALKISAFFIPFVLWTWGYFIFFNSKQLPFRFDTLEDASWSSIWRSIYVFLIQLLGGLLNPSFTWLLATRISSDYFGSIFHLRRYFKQMNLSMIKGSWTNFIKNHSEYFLYMTPQHLCTSVSQNIIILFIERRFGLFETGIFTLSQRLIQAPLEMIGGTLLNVSIQRFSELKHTPRDLKSFYLKVVALSLGLSIFIGFSIFISIDLLVPLLGPKWVSTSTTIKALIPYFMSLLIFIPSTQFLRVINKSRMQLGIEVTEVILKIALLSFWNFSSLQNMILGYGFLALFSSMAKTAFILKLIQDFE